LIPARPPYKVWGCAPCPGKVKRYGAAPHTPAKSKGMGLRPVPRRKYWGCVPMTPLFEKSGALLYAPAKEKGSSAAAGELSALAD